MQQESEIPERVVDREAYLEMLKIQKLPILNEKKNYKCTDGKVVSISDLEWRLKKSIEHLPEIEQRKIIKLKRVYQTTLNKLTRLKQLAFAGSYNGSNGKGGIMEERKQEILGLFGRMFTSEEVHRIMNKDWGIPVNLVTVQKFRKKYAPQIERLIDEYRISHADVRLGVKRSRLEELSWLYSNMKEKYIQKDRAQDYKLLLQTLESIRKEAEGEQVTINGKIDLNYEANIHLHLRNEVFKTLNLKEIILGRVAARMGISATRLIMSLNNSFYNKFSNVLGEFDPDQQGDAIFPSQMGYDFEKIRRVQTKIDEEIEEAEIVEEYSEEEKKKSSKKKETLAERIKKNRAKMKKSESELDAYAEIHNKRKEQS